MAEQHDKNKVERNKHFYPGIVRTTSYAEILYYYPGYYPRYNEISVMRGIL